MASVTINSGSSYRTADWYERNGPIDVNRLGEFHWEMEDICNEMEEAGLRWFYSVKVSEWAVNANGQASLGYDIVIEAECDEATLRNALRAILLPGE